MRKRRLVIVGGVAAGASAAAKARRTSEEIEITLLEAGPYISFANCGLPYYVGGEIKDRQKLFVTSAELFSRRFNVNVCIDSRAVEVRPKERTVQVLGPEGRNESLEYDRLVLATGTEPFMPPIPGLRARNILNVRTVPDVDAITALLEGRRSTRSRLRAVVVGGGYIGLEMAEQLVRLGLDVSLVEMADQVMLAMDPEMALPVEDALERAGVHLFTGDSLEGVVPGTNGSSTATTRSGRKLPFDLAIVAIGVRPSVNLAQSAGVNLGATGAIAVDQSQRTNVPEIFAAGDNSEMHHLVLGRPVNIPLAGPANKAGRVAGANAAMDLMGVPRDDPSRLRAPSILGTAVVRVFDCLAAVTGLTERQANAEGLEFGVSYMRGSNHAGYYPGSEPMLLKIVSERTSGRILGGQASGGEGVEKRIDVIATAIRGGLRLEDLEGLDLCYSPPVGSAKDVLIQAGFAGANSRRGVMPEVTPGELLDRLERGDAIALLDVRSRLEFSEGHLPGAVNIPLDELRDLLDQVETKQPLAVYCRSGYRSYVAQRVLLNSGWREVVNVQGGYLLITEFERLRRTAEKARARG